MEFDVCENSDGFSVLNSSCAVTIMAASTFDIIFSKNEIFQKVKNSNAINPEMIAKLYKVELSRIEQFSFFEPAKAIKFSIRRERPSGSHGESDVFGCQQYPPLFDIEIPNLED